MIGMTFRRVVSVDGWSAGIVGVFLMLWGPVAIPFLGGFMHQDNGSHSLIRLAGAGFFLTGALLLAIREIGEPSVQRRVSLAVFLTHTLAGMVVWAQQIAIWSSPVGAILAGWLTLMTLAFGSLLIRPTQREKLTL